MDRNGRPHGGYERILAVRGKRESARGNSTHVQNDSIQPGASARRRRQMERAAAKAQAKSVV